MPRKDKNDSLVYRYLLSLEYEKTWDNYTTIPQINEVLSKASKRNTGNEGYPDAIYVNSEKSLLILAEIKPSIAQFVSPMGKEDAEKYAVDGVKHYLSFFLKDALQKSSLKEFFEHWKIVGLAISGDPTDDYNHRIGTFLVNHDRIEEQKAVVDILCEADYLSLFENIDEEHIINPTKKEIQFLTKMLDSVSRYGIIIAPLSTYFKEESVRNAILKKHTLKYVINMPKDLFMPNAATNTAIAVFETNKPHADQEVIFYDLKDDGFVLSKSKGRTDAYNKWGKIKAIDIALFLKPIFESMKYKYNFGREISDKRLARERIKLPTKDGVTPDWDYMKRSSIKTRKAVTFKAAVTQNEVLHSISMDDWKEFALPDIFTRIESCKCSKAGDLVDGNDVYYLGAKKKDACVIKKVSAVPELITEGNCIAFICDGDGSVGYANYVPFDEFIGTTNLAVGYYPEINLYNALFLVAVLDLQRAKYSFGRKYKRRLNTTKIKLPAKGTAPDWEWMEDYIKSLPYGDRIQ